MTRVVPDKFNLLPEAGKPKKSPVCVPLKLKYFTIFKDQGDCDKRLPHFNFVYKKWQLLSNSQKEKYILSDGLTHLSYKILKEEMLMEGVKKITVEI